MAFRTELLTVVEGRYKRGAGKGKGPWNCLVWSPGLTKREKRYLPAFPTERAWSNNTSIAISRLGTQIRVSKDHYSQKRTRAPWRSCWLKHWGTRWARISSCARKQGRARRPTGILFKEHRSHLEGAHVGPIWNNLNMKKNNNVNGLQCIESKKNLWANSVTPKYGGVERALFHRRISATGDISALENHHFATTNVITHSGKIRSGC